MADQFPKPDEAETTRFLLYAEGVINDRLSEHPAGGGNVTLTENSQLVYVDAEIPYMVLIISRSGNDRADGIRVVTYFEQGHRFEISPRIFPEETKLEGHRSKGTERRRENPRDSHNIV